MSAQREIKDRMGELTKIEEILWHQTLRISWMKEGDKNTRFFHKTAVGRKRRNSIQRI